MKCLHVEASRENSSQKNKVREHCTSGTLEIITSVICISVTVFIIAKHNPLRY